MKEQDFIGSLRRLASHDAARRLFDDAAVLELGDTRLVLTHDMIVEGVHFLPCDPPGDIAWKLVAVNLSDLAAKGAKPVGALLGYTLSPDERWNEAFVRGLGSALEAFQLPLLGGDTVSAPPDGTRAFGLTAIGEARGEVPSRGGARQGDLLWVSGSIGGAGAGLRIALGELPDSPPLLERYRRPHPRLEAGRRLAPIVSAIMDVSDGLLIDSARMAEVSGAALHVQLDAVPLSIDLIALLGDSRSTRLEAVIAGDDYELLFAAPANRSEELLRLSNDLSLPLTCIGSFGEGVGLTLTDGDQPVTLPQSLGYEHRPA